MYQNLFSEKKIGTMTVPNRIVMTAMGNHCADADGSISEKNIAFYGARAKGGVGLVITECAIVDSATGKGNLRQITVDDDRYIPGLKALADEIHKYGSKIAVQIYHPGRQGIAAVNGVESMMAPSRTECQCVHQPTHEMTKEEIHDMVEKFASAAKRLQKAGIDAVELHGAHGYLICQFLSPYTNKRTDEYGGSLENRMRFLDEIIDAVRRECGPDYPVIVRFSADEHMEYAGLPEEGIHLEEGVRIARHLEKKGVDALDVSSGNYETMNTAWEPVGFDEGWKISGPEAVKKNVSIPVIGVSVIRRPAYAEQILADGKVDFIGSARAFLADPEWSNKAREGKEKEIRRCISCLYCMESLMGSDMSDVPFGCAVNYEGCREDEVSLASAEKVGEGRTVAVIGAGPAGLEAARVLASRGFKPVVLEKENTVGGQIRLASIPPKKEKTGALIEYLRTEAELLGVEVRLNQTVTLDLLKEINPYAVFIAQGSLPVMLKSIPGIDGAHVHTAAQILKGEVSFTGKNIGVIGSGMTGIETAELLGEQGNTVTVFEMADEIGPGMFFQNLIDVLGRVTAQGTALYPKHRLAEIHETDGRPEAVFDDLASGEKKTYAFDEVVVSLGMRANTELADEISRNFERVSVLGDASKAGRIEQAIRTGYEAAMKLM